MSDDNNSADLFHEILSSIRDVMSETKLDIKDIKVDISDIKVDVAHHILRTDLLQDEQKEQKAIVAQLQKDAWKLKGAFGIIAFLLTLFATWQVFKH
jgi:hypothetical protein